MKTFHTSAAQGDGYFLRVELLPEGLIKVNADDGYVVVLHSESGHSHVMDARYVEMYRLPEEIYECFLVVSQATALEHRREFDTHESIMFKPGTYRVRRQREYSPEGWRRAAD